MRLQSSGKFSKKQRRRNKIAEQISAFVCMLWRVPHGVKQDFCLFLFMMTLMVEHVWPTGELLTSESLILQRQTKIPLKCRFIGIYRFKYKDSLEFAITQGLGI